MPPYPQQITRPSATKAKVRYFATKLSRKTSRQSGRTTTRKTASTRIPISSDRLTKRLSVMASALLLFADLEGEQALRPQHQNSDNGEQCQHLRHRPGHEELERRLRLRDTECRCDGPDQAGGTAEHDHQKGIDDVELAGGRPGGADHGECAAGDAGDAAAEAKGVAIDFLGVAADGASHYPVLY